mgnify:CR=1 FL=1
MFRQPGDKGKEGYMTDALTLATKYAGFAHIETELLSGLENLELARVAVISAAEHMKSPEQEAVMEALSLVKRFMHQQRDASRSEIQKIRGVLSGDLESYDD